MLQGDSTLQLEVLMSMNSESLLIKMLLNLKSFWMRFERVGFQEMDKLRKKVGFNICSKCSEAGFIVFK